MQPVITCWKLPLPENSSCLMAKISMCLSITKLRVSADCISTTIMNLTLVLTGRYFQEINGKRVLLERGDFVFIPLGSHHQSFYEFGATRILNVGISKRFFEQHYLPLLPYCFVASQVYRTNNAFLTYVETVISSLNFRETGLEEFVEMVTFYVINRLRHYREEQVIDDVPQLAEKYGRKDA